MFQFFRPTACAAALALSTASLMHAPAHAQTASQLTRDSYAPPVTRSAEGGVSLPLTTGLNAPAGADKLFVTPGGLNVQGGFAELDDETATIAARLTGKRMSAAELFSAARDLEIAYARAGYLLARVSVPPQTVKNGAPLQLVVTDGYVASVDVSALPARIQGPVASRMARLIGRHHLSKRDLERHLLLAGDLPGLQMRTTLKPGDAPGSAIIVVDGRQDAVTGSLNLDNSMSRDLGRAAFRLGANANSLLGLGEVAYLHLGGYPGLDGDMFSDDPRNRQIVGGVTVPLGASGAWINLEAVDSRTHPDSDESLVIRDKFQRLTMKLGYNWLRARDANTATTVSLAIENEDQTLLYAGTGYAFAKDRLRVLRLSQTGDVFLPWGGHVFGSGTLSFGLDGLGARTPTTALPASRDGAGPDFSKLEAEINYLQGFAGERLRLGLSAKGQTAFGAPLPSSEQLSLDGADWMAAFEIGTLVADTGVVLRGELGMPQAYNSLAGHSDLAGALSPYLFAAAGIAQLEQPTAVEAAITRAASFGAGLRLALNQANAPFGGNIKLEYAHGVESDAKPIDRFNIGFMVHF